MEESEASRSAAETNSLDRSSCQQKDPGVMYFTGPITAACVARFAQLRRARTCSATGSSYSWLKPCFSDIPGKNDPHIGVLAAIQGSGWDKLSGKKQLDLKGLTSQ